METRIDGIHAIEPGVCLLSWASPDLLMYRHLGKETLGEKGRICEKICGFSEERGTPPAHDKNRRLDDIIGMVCY
jgi:hypothetical protein